MTPEEGFRKETRQDSVSVPPYHVPALRATSYHKVVAVPNGTAVAKPLYVLDLRLSEFLS